MKYYSMNLDASKIDSNIIRLACTIQLRVMIVALKYGSSKFSSEQVASNLKISISQIEEAMEFWVNLRIIRVCPEFTSEQSVVSSIESKSKEYLVRRIASNEEVDSFFQEVENIMGRPLSGTDISVILSLKDSEGLNFDVILILIKYCVKINKGSIRYIQKIGISWSKGEINSIERAKKQIRSLQTFEKIWIKFRKIIGIPSRSPTKREEESLKRWFIEWKFSEEMIAEAYERCVNSKGTYILSYMDGIIKKWEKNNIKKIEDINDRKPAKPKASYNLEKYFSINVLDPKF